MIVSNLEPEDAMRLTTHTDYALRVLIYLGLQGPDLVTIQEVSERYGISKNHLMKIVHELSQAGFIESVRGKNGGIRLGHPAETIIVGDIIRLMEGDMAIVECMRPNKPICQLMPSCILKEALEKALAEFLSTLDQYTLADLLDNPEQMSKLLSSPKTV